MRSNNKLLVCVNTHPPAHAVCHQTNSGLQKKCTRKSLPVPWVPMWIKLSYSRKWRLEFILASVWPLAGMEVTNSTLFLAFEIAKMLQLPRIWKQDKPECPISNDSVASQSFPPLSLRPEREWLQPARVLGQSPACPQKAQDSSQVSYFFHSSHKKWAQEVIRLVKFVSSRAWALDPQKPGENPG